MGENFIPPRSDPMFKRVFADPRDLQPLRSFLGTVLTVPAEDLVDLTLVDTHLKPEHASDKESVVDVHVRTKSGREIEVEIQLVHHRGFERRLAYYTARMLASQLSAGQNYHQMPQAICVAITDFVAVPGDDKYHHCFRLADRKRGVALTDALEIHLLELPKGKQYPDGTLLWNWLNFLSAHSEAELDMAATQDPVIADAVTKVHFFSEAESLRRIHEYEWKRLADKLSYEAGVRLDAEEEMAAKLTAKLAEGLAEGRAETLAEGRAEGRSEGRAEGADAKQAELVRRMLEYGMPADDVAQMAQLSLDDVLALADPPG